MRAVRRLVHLVLTAMRLPSGYGIGVTSYRLIIHHEGVGRCIYSRHLSLLVILLRPRQLRASEALACL